MWLCGLKMSSVFYCLSLIVVSFLCMILFVWLSVSMK